MKIVIVEDEAKTAADLKTTLEQTDRSVEIMQVLDSIEATVEYFKRNAMPDLIFMDIQLADGLSFEIFKSVNVTCPVVFCTAFDEYAIEAFKSNGVDYILKPFDEPTIARSLQKITQLENHFTSQNALFQTLSKTLTNRKTYKTGFLVPAKDKMVPVSTSDIACFFINDELVFLQTFSNNKYLVNYTLDEIELMLDPAWFYRANRQFILNYAAVKEVEHYFARKLVAKVSVTVPESIVISKAKASDFLRWMENR